MVARGVSTVFVTHYHDLARAAARDRPQVANYHMSYTVVGRDASTTRLSVDDDVVMLYKLAPGLAAESFGLHAAKAAGLPDAVLKLAQAKAEELEARRREGDGA